MRLLTTEEAATEARRDLRTIRRWRRAGRLKPFLRRVDGTVLYRIEDVWRAERDARHHRPSAPTT